MSYMVESLISAGIVKGTFPPGKDYAFFLVKEAEGRFSPGDKVWLKSTDVCPTYEIARAAALEKIDKMKAAAHRQLARLNELEQRYRAELRAEDPK